MGNSAPAPPPVPDPFAIATAQTGSNVDTAIASQLLGQVNQITPFGTSTFNQTGATNVGGNIVPQFTQTQTLNPLAQEQFDLQGQLGIDLTQLGFQGTDLIAQALGQGVDTSGLPSISTDFEGDALRAEEAIFGRATNLLQPLFDEQNRASEVRLSERGIPIGSEIFTNERDRLGRSQNEALQNAAFDAVLGGQNRQGDLLSQALASRGQGFQEAAFLNNLPFNQVASLLGTAPGINAPQFAPIPQFGVAPTDVIGAQLGSAQIASNNFQAQLQAPSLLGGLLSAGGQIGAGFAMASARDLKENFAKVPDVLDRVNELEVLEWNYKADPLNDLHIGVMAEDFAHNFGGSLRYIDVISYLGVLTKSIQELSAEVRRLKNA